MTRRTEGIDLRRLETSDLPFAQRLVEVAGWNQTTRDWEVFLERDPDGALLARRGGVPAGTVATIRYGDVAWISMLLVAPEHRGRGVGTALLERALEHLSSVPTVMLDATPAGRPIYEAHGFTAEHDWTRLRRPPGEGRALPPEAVQHVGDERVAALDDSRIEEARHLLRLATGLERDWLFDVSRERAPHLTLAALAEGSARGVALGRVGRTATQLGPCAGLDRGSAVALLREAAAVADARQEPLIADAPHGSDAERETRAAVWSALGFQPDRVLTRMRRGPPLAPESPQLLWAIAGPEFG